MCLAKFLCVADVAGWVQLRAMAGQIFPADLLMKVKLLGAVLPESPAEFWGSRNLAFSCPWSSISDDY